MPLDEINVGTSANDGTGDPIRTAFQKTNAAIAAVNAGGGGETPQQITTGGSTTQIDPADGLLIEITSGGTAGNEDVELMNFSVDGNGNNFAKNGTVATIYLKTQADPADVIRVYRDGHVGIAQPLTDSAGLISGSYADDGGSLLDGVGLSSVWQWWDNQWVPLNYSQNNDSEFYAQNHLSPSATAAAPQTSVATIAIVTGDAEAKGFASANGDLGVTITSEQITSGAAPITLSVSHHSSFITTGGTAGVENASIANPADSQLGFYKHILLGARTNGGDSVSVSVTNIKDAAGGDLTSIILDAVNEYAVIQAYSPTAWRVFNAASGVVT